MLGGSPNTPDERRIAIYQLHILLDDKEHEKLLELVKVTGLSRSALIRSLILGQELRSKPPEEIAQLLRHLSAMGNNINQIARVANSKQSVNPETLEEIKTMQSALWREIKGM